MTQEIKKPTIYKSDQLKKAVVMWANMYKIKKKDVDLTNVQFKNKLKAFTKRLQEKNIPVKKFDFNNDSILDYLNTLTV